MNIKKILSAALAFSMLFAASVNASAAVSTVARKTVHTVSPGLKYISSIEVNGGIRQEIHSFEYKPGSDTAIVPAYGNYIYGFNSVGSMVSSYSGEGRVVGGINTDFYITSTGIPLSCLISDGEIISSCDSRAAIGFDADGRAVIGFPEISARLVNEDRELPIAHINKTPAVWGMYLVTDKFSSTTKTSEESIEIVLQSFDKDATESAMSEHEKEFHEDAEEEVNKENEENEESEENDENEDVSVVPEEAAEQVDYEIADNIDKRSETENTEDEVRDDASENKSKEENGEASSEQKETMVVENDDEKDDETNEDNETASTESRSEQDTAADSNEEPAKQPEPLQPALNMELFQLTKEKLSPNGAIDVVITEIRDGVKNGSIPENSYVLCVPKEQLGYLAADLKVGDTFTLETKSSDLFDGCVSIFGAGSVILADGEYVKQSNDSIYLYRNPRTAAGIRPDGSVVFVCVDGRRPGESNGFTAAELANYMISLGCTYAVNFDGGGSTTFYAADIGEERAVLKNIPSEGSERRVADGLLFVNKSEPTMNRMYASLYPKHFLTFNKGTAVDISGTVKFADTNSHPMKLGEGESVVLGVDPYYGFTYNNVFVPNGTPGRAEIYAEIPESGEYYSVGFVDITDIADRLNFKAEDSFLTPFEPSTELSAQAFLNTLPVAFTPYSIQWSIEEEAAGEDGEKVRIPVDEIDAYIYTNDAVMQFIPVRRDTNYIVTASLGDYSETIEIFAEAHPFDDMEMHWASEMSYDMYTKGLLLGETDSSGTRNFMPSRNMTRAEFCTVLARLLELEITYKPEISEPDLSEQTSEYDGKPEASVIREQLEQNVKTNQEPAEDTSEEFHEEAISSDEKIDSIPESGQNADEYDLSDVPEWAKGYVHALYVNGYIDVLITIDEDGRQVLNAEDYVTRNDVIRVLGSLLDGEENPEITEKFDDYVPERENDSMFFSRVVENGIISGYEDGTVRQHGTLTRAEAAAVFSRFLNVYS